MNKYREGKVKSTPVRGVKQHLQPSAYKVWEPARVTACLLHNESTTYRDWETECEMRVQSHGVDPNAGDLTMSRLKRM